MTRFDDELRRASAPLAAESLPPDVLDDALDASAARPPWVAFGTVVAAAIAVFLAGGIGIGSLLPTPSPSPPAIASVAPSAPVATSDPVTSTCESAAAGEDGTILIFFPCGAPPNVEPVGVVRSVAPGLSVADRLRQALVALLKGPTASERQAGLVGIVADGAGVEPTVDVASDGLAMVDFPRALTDVNNLSTTAAGGAFLAAVRATTLQFDEVTAADLRLDGSCDALFDYFGSVCQHFTEPVSEVSDCPIIAPAELPSGAAVGEPRPYPGRPMVSWGSGDDTVTQLPGHRSGGPVVEDGTAVHVRGYAGFVGSTGDLPMPPAISIAWVEEGCPYDVFVRLPGGEEAAIDYAARFGPVMTAASPPPAEAVTVTAEDDGIRLTVTLDRGRTVYGRRVMATTVVENIGQGPVFWGHSSTCPYPTGLTIRPDAPVRLRPGREDWPGDQGILKLVSVHEYETKVDPAYPFQPEGWLDSEGMGCTSDLLTSELPAGESLVHRVGWDTMGPHDMPPPPGNYTVEAIFAFMSRGAPPVGPEAVDEFAVTLAMPMVIEGPPIDYVSPGEAVDALLSDEAFRALLEDAPRDLWVESRLTFVDRHWELVLYLTHSSLEVEPVEAIVGLVDARSGTPIEVVREPRTRPQGG